MPKICVDCGTIMLEGGIDIYDYCDDCASPETQTFKCPECKMDFIGDLILNAFNLGHPLCYECYNKSQNKLNES